MKNEPIIDSPTETDSKNFNDTFENSSKTNLSWGSIRNKQNNSPTKEYHPNLSPTATVRSTMHPSPRLGRPKSFYERPTVSPPCIPLRPAPEIRDNVNRMSYHPNLEPESRLYPKLDYEILDLQQGYSATQTLDKSSSELNGPSSIPAKPPRLNSSKSPIPDSTHL